MSTLFWLAAALVLYTYAGYPLLIALRARLFPHPWIRKDWTQSPQPLRVSVLMAVHNGAPMLRAKMQQLLALDPHLVTEVLVVSDGSTDETDRILEEFTDPRLKTFALEAHSGKSTALNHGIAAATGDILLFTDIRPHIESSSLVALLANFADPDVGCVAGELILKGTETQSATTQNIGGLYWRYEQWMRNCEAAFDSPVGVYGGFYAARRSLVRPLPNGLILDDMFQPLSILRQGYRSVVDPAAIVVDTWPAQTGAEFQRKVRTLAGNFQLIARAPWILTPTNRVLFQLVSHKLLRLLVPYALLVMLVTSCVLGAHSLPWAIAALLQTLFWIAGLLSLRIRIPTIHRAAAAIGALLVLNAAAVVALYRFLFTRGPLWKIWSATAHPSAERLVAMRERSL